jgi:hypothetical protein
MNALARVPALALAACVAGAGCLLLEVEGVPCGDDEECPSGYFCDIPREGCRAESDAQGPPELVIELVRDGKGAEVRAPQVAPDETTRLGFLVENRGRGPAESMRLTLAELSCFAFLVEGASVPATLAAGARAAIDVDVTPAPGCNGLHILDWFLTWSGRETRGSVDVNVRAE